MGTALTTTEEMYRWFAERDGDDSPSYRWLAYDVLATPALLALMQEVTERQRQPHLFFGALRLLGAPLSAAWAVEHWADVAAVLRTRQVQTNEPGRCATLLPALATLPEPLALVEVGASAGLCLRYESYTYDYGGVRVGTGSPVLRCEPRGAVPVPDRVPEIAWRAGLDRNPLDPADPDTRHWLECLVWPEQDDRRETLHAALDLAVQDPPRVERGDLLDDLPALLDQVPAGTTPVVLHSAALAYVDDAKRDAFLDLLRERGVHRLGVEGALRAAARGRAIRHVRRLLRRPAAGVRAPARPLAGVAVTQVPWDMDAYLTRVRQACYVCELLAGNPDYEHHVVHRDETAVVYLCKYPVIWGHVLVAPVRHREHVVGDSTRTSTSRSSASYTARGWR